MLVGGQCGAGRDLVGNAGKVNQVHEDPGNVRVQEQSMGIYHRRLSVIRGLVTAMGASGDVVVKLNAGYTR